MAGQKGRSRRRADFKQSGREPSRRPTMVRSVVPVRIQYADISLGGGSGVETSTFRSRPTCVSVTSLRGEKREFFARKCARTAKSRGGRSRSSDFSVAMRFFRVFGFVFVRAILVM